MARPRPLGPRRFASPWKQGGLSLRQLAIAVFRNALEDDILARTSQLAFNYLLALFPLLLFLVSLFGLFASRSSQLEDRFVFYIADFLPPTAFQLLMSVTREMAHSATRGKLTFGFLLSLWFASGGMTTMIATLNVVYRVRETRSWLKVRALAVALTLALAVFLVSALLIVLLGDRFMGWIGLELHMGTFIQLLWKGLQWPAALLLVIASFSLVYYFGPNVEDRRWHWITPGSIFGVLVWAMASGIFRAYLHFFNSYGTTYGSIGALMILSVWLYVTGLSFLAGGEVNAEIERAAKRIEAEGNTPGASEPASSQ